MTSGCHGYQLVAVFCDNVQMEVACDIMPDVAVETIQPRRTYCHKLLQDIKTDIHCSIRGKCWVVLRQTFLELFVPLISFEHKQNTLTKYLQVYRDCVQIPHCLDDRSIDNISLNRMAHKKLLKVTESFINTISSFPV